MIWNDGFGQWLRKTHKLSTITIQSEGRLAAKIKFKRLFTQSMCCLSWRSRKTAWKGEEMKPLFWDYEGKLCVCVDDAMVEISRNIHSDTRWRWCWRNAFKADKNEISKQIRNKLPKRVPENSKCLNRRSRGLAGRRRRRRFSRQSTSSIEIRLDQGGSERAPLRGRREWRQRL